MKPRKQIPRLFVVNDNTVLRIVPTLAQEIGLNESIMLLQIDFLKSISTTDDKKGRPWTYQSIRNLQAEYFPFWSKNTINRTIDSLQKKRLIRCDNFNKASYDRTRWISINYGKVNQLKSIMAGGLSQNGTRSVQNGTRSVQNGTTIPESSTERTTDISGASNMLPRTFEQEKKKKNTKKEKTKEILTIPEIQSLLNILAANGTKLSTVSSNLKMLMLHAVEAHGVEFCEAAIRGRIIQAARDSKPLWLSTLFDPEKGEWLSDCAKLGTESVVRISRAPQLTPEQEREYRELSHRVPA